VDHSPPSSTEVKDECSYTSVPSICLQGVDRDNFNFDYFVLRFHPVEDLFVSDVSW